jgi:hypothetical protein
VDAVFRAAAARDLCSKDRPILTGIQMTPTTLSGVVARRRLTALGAGERDLRIVLDVNDDLTRIEVKGDLSDPPRALQAKDLSV